MKKTINDFVYEIKDNGEITIDSYSGNCEELTIPDSIEGKPVTTMRMTGTTAWNLTTMMTTTMITIIH